MDVNQMFLRVNFGNWQLNQDISELAIPVEAPSMLVWSSDPNNNRRCFVTFVSINAFLVAVFVIPFIIIAVLNFIQTLKKFVKTREGHSGFHFYNDIGKELICD